MEPVHIEKLHGLTIKIFHDESLDFNPQEGDDNIFLVGYNHHFCVDAPKVYRRDQNGKRIEGDKGHFMFDEQDLQRYFKPELVCPKCESDNIEERENKIYCFCCEKTRAKAKELRPEVFKDFHVFPLSAYIHSGVALYMGNHKVCPWDSCQVGAVLVAKSEFKNKAKAEKVASGLVEIWNDYLSGNVYRYVIVDDNEDEVDSCWGYYGDYEKENGALIAARQEVEAKTKNGKTDHKGQLLLTI